jgi:sulfate adenylyltransferase
MKQKLFLFMLIFMSNICAESFLCSKNKRKELYSEANNLVSLRLTDRQSCDIELLLNGGFAPLQGFLNQKDYDSVVGDMRLSDGTLWPMPITLDATTRLAKSFKVGDKLALRDQEGFLLAVLDIESIYKPNKELEAKSVFGTVDVAHPGVNYLFNSAGDMYIGGKLTGAILPRHYDNISLRKTPAQLKQIFKERGWKKIVAFQTRNPMHRAHREITVRAAEKIGGHLLLHPVVGMTKPGDVDHFTRVRCYEKIMQRYPEGLAELSLLPIAMRMAGPREALWHAIIRKNYGCTHFIVGRDHAGPGLGSDGRPFYGPYEAQAMVAKHQAEVGIEMVPFQMMSYVADYDQYMTADETPAKAKVLSISGTELRRRLMSGEEIPEWFGYPEVVKELRWTYPARSKQGFTVFFTGLSGAGKSTLAKALRYRLMEHSRRYVSLLDGDLVRINLSSELGFSAAHRDLNIKRIGFVAFEVTKNKGIAICAPIAPYAKVRDFNRSLISKVGGYIEVHVSTPLQECEDRDTKGLYAKAREGLIKEFTGISDPYEAPKSPEVKIDTTNVTPEAAVDIIMDYLKGEGYIK